MPVMRKPCCFRVGNVKKGPACKVNWAGHSAKIKYGGACLEVFCWI